MTAMPSSATLFARLSAATVAGALSSVRADDLGAVPLVALMARHAGLDWPAVTDVTYGCAHRAREGSRPGQPRQPSQALASVR